MRAGCVFMKETGIQTQLFAVAFDHTFVDFFWVLVIVCVVRSVGHIIHIVIIFYLLFDRHFTRLKPAYLQHYISSGPCNYLPPLSAFVGMLFEKVLVWLEEWQF